MSERDWKQTPTLDEFNAMYDEDDNIWWRIACGHHQNLYEAAVERYQTAEAQIQAVRELHCLTVDVVDGPGGPEDVEHCQECGYIGVDAEPCPTIRILDGERDE